MSNTTNLKSFYDGRKVLVTGGAGFIGSHLTRGLVNLGAEVRVIDDLSGGHLTNLNDVADRITFLEASILSHESLTKICDNIDLVFHEAALASVPASIEQPETYHDVNVTGMLRVLEAARAGGAKRIVFASSSAVYGDQPELPKHEDQSPDPLSPYAQQKLTGEHMLTVWARCYGMTTIALRYFNIFGPCQRADSAYAAVIAAFADALLHGRPPVIFGDGLATRDFTYIDNVVQANLLAGAFQTENPDDMIGKTINIALGGQVSVVELAQAMIDIIGADVSPEFAPPRAGDILHSFADISTAQNLLGYKPTVGLEEGLKATIDWYKSMM